MFQDISLKIQFNDDRLVLIFFFIIISKCQMFQNISLKIQFDTNRLVLIFISNVKCLKMSSFFKLSLLGFNLIALI